MNSQRFSAAKPFFALLLAGCLGVLLNACQKKSGPTEPQPVAVCPTGNTATTTAAGYQKILGSWNWVQDLGQSQLGGTLYRTPATTGNVIRLEFRDNRSYQYIENQSILESGTYALRQAETYPILMLDLLPNGKESSASLFRSGALLTLCDEGLVLRRGQRRRCEPVVSTNSLNVLQGRA